MEKHIKSTSRRTGKELYEQLRTAVICYQLLPQQHLQVMNLARRLGVSTTPVRETLNRLYAEGLLAFEPNKGFSIKPLDPREMIEAYQCNFLILKHAIEANAAKLETITIEPPVDALGEQHAEAAAKPYASFVENLYVDIALLSDNRLMVEIVRRCNARTHYVRFLDLKEPKTLARVHRDVLHFLQVVKSGNAAAAVSHLECQLARALKVIPYLVGNAMIDMAKQAGGEANGTPNAIRNTTS